jgi:Na+-driven multidrug efflux pump
VGTLAGAVANIFFDYALIFGKAGLPQLGFNGAAYASVIAEFIEMSVLFLVIRSKGIFSRFAVTFRFNWISSYVRSIVDISGPLVFQHAISVISWMFFYILIERNSGSTGLAVSNTMRNIFGFFGVFIWAFASTTNAMVSNVIGQGRKDDVMPLIHKIIKLSSAIALFICLMLNLFPGTYLSIYGLSGEFITTGVPVLRVVTFALIFMSFSTVWLNAVTGSGNSRVTFLIELSTIFFYCIYVFVVLEVYQLPLMMAWMSEYVYWSLLFIQSFLFMKSNKWRKKVI